ncbi:hypothetical protein [Paenibacillus methanolicus]|uniref:Uncharacterized protein n=1 Tax=Paenibacillus methanolicus TaxID=582686 RepID=A0A5S5BMK4_9BACL|nr:hypothetical protein [Paenibacillus methanolicus]TYP68365.1 hypothetical protein BCM02_11950 [Paenibacillus methanolicus]
MKNQESWVNVAFLLLIPLLILAGYKASLDPGRAAAPPGSGVSPRLSAFIGAGPGSAQAAIAAANAGGPIASAYAPPTTASGQLEPIPLYIQSGTYAQAGASSRREAIATLEQLGDNRYRLHAAVRLSGHEAGGLDAEFSVDGQTIAFHDDAYRELSLALGDDSLTIDYPANAFGEPGADLRGIYYLRSAPSDESPFLRALYDSIQLSGTMRQGQLVIHTYPLGPEERWLLLEARDGESGGTANPPSLVRYRPAAGQFTPITWEKAQETLRMRDASEAMIYEITHKRFADRYREVLADRTIRGTPDKAPLSEQEAFYIAVGERSVTRTEQLRDEPEATGSRYIQVVDSSDEAAVLVHLYELVEDAEESHTATIDWLEVDRLTGRVSSMFEA